MRRLLDRMDRIERNFDTIFVRQRMVSGEYQSLLLSELSAKEATKWIFKWLREAINVPASDDATASASGDSSR